MGRVMAALKSRYAGRMDFGKVGPMVKDRLLRLEPGATRFVMQRTGRFAPLREGLGDRLVTFDGRWSAVWRHMVRTHGLREAWRRRLSPPAPVFVAQAEGNVARKVRRLPELARLPGFVAAYARRKAKHAEFLTDMLERLLADLPEPVAVVYNGSYVPDATLAAVAGAGRRVYIENGYFRGTIQADPLGINDDNFAAAGPGVSTFRYQPDDRPLDMVLDTRDPKHGVQAAVGLPAGYVFVPFQVGQRQPDHPPFALGRLHGGVPWAGGGDGGGAARPRLRHQGASPFRAGRCRAGSPRTPG